MKKKLIVGVLSHVDSGGKDDIFPGRALHYIDRIYSDKLIEFGLIPLIIPVNNKSSEYIDFLLEMVDGILGTGGGKIPLNLLNQNTIPKLIETSPERYEFEKNFLLEAYKKIFLS